MLCEQCKKEYPNAELGKVPMADGTTHIICVHCYNEMKAAMAQNTKAVKETIEETVEEHPSQKTTKEQSSNKGFWIAVLSMVLIVLLVVGILLWNPFQRVREAKERANEASAVSQSAGQATEAIPEIHDFKNIATIKEKTMYNWGGMKVIAKSLTYTDESLKLNMQFVNHTNSKRIFKAEVPAASFNAVNGYMIEAGALSCEVPAGKSAMGTMEIPIKDLMLYGITVVEELQTGFVIEDKDGNEVYTVPVWVRTNQYGKGNNKSTYQKNVQSKRYQAGYGYTLKKWIDKPQTVMKGVTILSQGYRESTFGDRVLMLEVENKTKETIFFTTNSIKLNGRLVFTTMWNSCGITPNKRMIVEIPVDEFIKEKNIKTVKNMEFRISVKDDGYMNLMKAKNFKFVIEE